MSTIPNRTLSSSYIPVTPFTATYGTTLSQDLVLSASVVADSTSASPVAAFINTLTTQVVPPPVEALVVSNGQLNHVSRNLATDCGWAMTPLFSDSTVKEVTAGTMYAGTSNAGIYAAYQDASGINVTQLQSDGSTWGTPAIIQSGSASNLRTAYSPDGRLVFYAVSASGDLLLVYQSQTNGPFSAQTCTMPNKLSDGDYFLCMTNEDNWTLAANQNAALYIYVGQLDSTQPSQSGIASNYTGTINQVVFGYWSPYFASLMFLFVDSTNTLQVWAQAGGGVTPIPPSFAGATVTAAKAHVYTDPNSGQDTISVYTVDNLGNLSVLHQDSDDPWSNGVPNWVAYIPLDSGAGMLSIDANPANVPTLFVLSAADASLRQYQQDANTQMWQALSVLQNDATCMEVTRFRAEVSVVDSAGIPVGQAPISLGLADGYSGVDLWVDGAICPLNSQAPLSLTTDPTGKLTLAVLVMNSIVAPELILTMDGLSEPLSVQPASGVHTYLSGVGTLNPTNPPNPLIGAGPLPVFDAAGNTLANAILNGTQLSPGANQDLELAGVAASAIQAAANAGLNTTASQTVGGYRFDLTRNSPGMQILATPDEVQQHVALLLGQEQFRGVFSRLSRFFSEVLTGIKNGLVTLKKFVVDAATHIVTLAISIGNSIDQGLQIALSGLEQAGHFIAGVFQAVETDVQDVVDWLKEMFDFAAIFRTQAAFEQMAVAYPTAVSTFVSGLEAPVSGWFSQQETTINGYLQQLAAQFSGQTFESLPNAQSPQVPTDGGPVVEGLASVADLVSSVNLNWLWNKILSYLPSNGDIGLEDDSFAAAWNTFSNIARGSIQDFYSALQSFADALQSFIKNPSTFNSFGIPDMINAVQGLVSGLLTLADGAAEGVLTFVSSAMATVATMLSTAISIAPLQSLWTWLQKKAGISDPAPLTVGSLFTLLAAFPITLGYKLVLGADQEPFPATLSEGLISSSAWPTRKTILASAIIHLYSTLPSIWLDIYMNDTELPPLIKFYSGFLLVINLVDYVTRNGLPSGGQTQGAALVILAMLILLLALRIGLQGVYARLDNYLMSNPAVIIPGLLTAYGASTFILDIVQIFLDQPDAAIEASYLLEPMTSLFSFLNLPYFRDDPEVAPFALGTKIAADVVGCVGAGVAELVDAIKQMNVPMPPSAGLAARAAS